MIKKNSKCNSKISFFVFFFCIILINFHFVMKSKKIILVSFIGNVMVKIPFTEFNSWIHRALFSWELNQWQNEYPHFFLRKNNKTINIGNNSDQYTVCLVGFPLNLTWLLFLQTTVVVIMLSLFKMLEQVCTERFHCYIYYNVVFVVVFLTQNMPKRMSVFKKNEKKQLCIAM